MSRHDFDSRRIRTIDAIVVRLRLLDDLGSRHTGSSNQSSLLADLAGGCLSQRDRERPGELRCHPVLDGRAMVGFPRLVRPAPFDLPYGFPLMLNGELIIRQAGESILPLQIGLGPNRLK